MGTEAKKQAKNRKADILALGEWYINTVLLAPKAKDIIAGAKEAPERLKEAREALAKWKADSIASKVPEASFDKLVKIIPELKALMAEIENLENVEGRTFESAMSIVRKRVPASILANLELTFEPDPEGQPLPLRFRIGRMRSAGAGGGSRGFSPEHHGNEYHYIPSNGKHGVRGRVRVGKDGEKAFLDVIAIKQDGTDGKAKTHAVKTFSEASRILHEAAGLTYADGKGWVPPNEVWKEAEKPKAEK